MNSFSSGEEELKSKFHGSFFYIERIDHILRKLDNVTVSREVETNGKEKLSQARKDFSSRGY